MKFLLIPLVEDVNFFQAIMRLQYEFLLLHAMIVYNDLLLHF
jgi:hypothetical protein